MTFSSSQGAMSSGRRAFTALNRYRRPGRMAGRTAPLPTSLGSPQTPGATKGGTSYDISGNGRGGGFRRPGLRRLRSAHAWWTDRSDRPAPPPHGSRQPRQAARRSPAVVPTALELRQRCGRRRPDRSFVHAGRPVVNAGWWGGRRDGGCAPDQPIGAVTQLPLGGHGRRRPRTLWHGAKRGDKP